MLNVVFDGLKLELLSLLNHLFIGRYELIVLVVTKRGQRLITRLFASDCKVCSGLRIIIILIIIRSRSLKNYRESDDYSSLITEINVGFRFFLFFNLMLLFGKIN